MTIEEFRARLDEFDQHVAAIMQMFEDDTGVRVDYLEAFSNDDDTVSVYTGVNFPKQKEVE